MMSEVQEIEFGEVGRQGRVDLDEVKCPGNQFVSTRTREKLILIKSGVRKIDSDEVGRPEKSNLLEAECSGKQRFRGSQVFGKSIFVNPQLTKIDFDEVKRLGNRSW
eukprot:GEMP01119171.1.p1 GENE.GEMP01119171.1~~GEMP01119171.1.p1  ORF type:complete len:107 (+),score=14.25 GEMP01119171.1:224-544(+)